MTNSATTADSTDALSVPQALETGGSGLLRVFEYDRSLVTGGIAHIGVGNFHRVHQGVYLDDLMNSRSDHGSWGIVGIGLRSSTVSQAKAAVYARQDNLYTATLYTPEGIRESRIVGSMIEYHYGPADPVGVIERLTDPAIRIVSLTVTEGGYFLDETTGHFRTDAPEIAEDLLRTHPETTFGVISSALRLRRERGIAPFTVMSCDNLRGNGNTARTATVGYAAVHDPALAEWIAGNVSFPNSMVDRIAPTVGPERRERLNHTTGTTDDLPALSESYRQWVIEDDFPTGRPAWEDLGVELRPDVEAFEAMKGRLLNASHMLLAYPAALAGYDWVHQAASDPAIAGLLQAFMRADAAPLLDAPAGVSLEEYQAMIVGRFANENVPDTVLRVAHDGGAKLPVFHRATAEGLIAAGRNTRRAALLVAAFRRYTAGIDDNGKPFDVQEPHLEDADWPMLTSDDPLDALATSPFAAWKLRESDAFVAEYTMLVRILADGGIHAAIAYAVAD